MARLGDVAAKVRSKNAGPFWLTIDVFCGSADAFERIARALDAGRIADTLQIEPQTIRRFDIADLDVVKISFPRPTVQGAIDDRDLHGAIMEMAGNRSLAAALKQIVGLPVLVKAFSSYSDDDLWRSFHQHENIVDALRAGDANWAEAAMRSHILAGRAILLPAARS